MFSRWNVRLELLALLFIFYAVTSILFGLTIAIMGAVQRPTYNNFAVYIYMWQTYPWACFAHLLLVFGTFVCIFLIRRTKGR